jgi:hypothetical protein
MSSCDSLSSDCSTALTTLIAGFIVPIAMAMSVRTLSLFMQLASLPKRALLPIWIPYVSGSRLRLAEQLERPFDFAFGVLGAIIDGMTIVLGDLALSNPGIERQTILF